MPRSPSTEHTANVSPCLIEKRQVLQFSFNDATIVPVSFDNILHIQYVYFS